MEKNYFTFGDGNLCRSLILGNLIGAAMHREYRHYSDIEKQTGIQTFFERNPQHRNWWFFQLGEINGYEIKQGRPPITAIVVKKDGKFLPGMGFYNCLHQHGVLKNNPQYLSDLEKKNIHERYLNEVWDYWNNVYLNIK